MAGMIRRFLPFRCEGVTLAGTLDVADGAANGLLIVGGGTEIRAGPHNGMALLAKTLAENGVTTLRYDRRGVGDSEGDDPGFEQSGPDIAAALAALRTACPTLDTIYALGNCDAATALVLHHHGLDLSGLLLTNVWAIEAQPSDEARPHDPPAAAIRARYIRQLTSVEGWKKIVSGSIDYRKLLNGIIKIARKAPVAPPDSLTGRMSRAMAHSDTPIHLLLAGRDNTALAFKDAWDSAAMADARARTDIHLKIIDTGSHSFAGAENQQALRQFCLAAMGIA
jgi:exosortase A-associated hydrolase 1